MFTNLFLFNRVFCNVHSGEEKLPEGLMSILAGHSLIKMKISFFDDVIMQKRRLILFG